MTAPADYLSQLDLGSPVQPGNDKGDLACTPVSTEGFSELERHLVSIANYVSELSTDQLGNEMRREMRRSIK